MLLQDIPQRQRAQQLARERAERVHRQRGEAVLPLQQVVQARDDQLPVRLRCGKEHADAPAEQAVRYSVLPLAERIVAEIFF